MSTENKLPRLGKAASEFNVGISTIVSLLKKKNHEIEANPNSRLTPEMYDILVKEFNGDKLVKEEAKKIEIGSYNKVKHDSVEPTLHKTEPEHETPIITQTPKATPVVPEVLKVEVQKPKVIGKINLDDKTPKKEVKVEIVPPVDEITVIEPIVAPIPEEPKMEIVPPVEIQPETKAEPEVTIQPEVKTKPVMEQNPITVEVITPLEPIVQEVVPPVDVTLEQEPIVPTPETKKPEHFETKVENLSDNIKIVDKIDLDQFNRPPKRKNPEPVVKITPKQEPVAEAITPEIVPAETPVVVKPEGPVRDANFLETKYEKLQAPIIKGKIDLNTVRPKEHVKKDQNQHNHNKNNNNKNQSPQQNNPNQANQPNQQNQNKPATTPSTTNTSTTTSDANKKKRKRTRIKQNTTQQGGGNPNNKVVPVQKVEITDEDIQRQIRETMQRLEPLGKSKTSKRRREKRAHNQTEMREHEMQELQESKVLKITEFLTANELATLMNLQVTQIISTCMSVGLAVSINQRLDAETIS